MKPILKTIVFLLPFIIHINNSMAQASEKEISKEFYRADGNINLIINYLPAGWSFREENGCFIISRKDSALMLIDTSMNFSTEKSEARNKRIQEHGVKILPQIVIRHEDKWDFLRIQEAQIRNSELQGQLYNLADKMGVAPLLDAKLSRKGRPVYTAVTEADKKKLANYYKEKEKLEKKIITVPDFSSQNYSLFIVSSTGKIDDTHIVYPASASNEVYTILALFREACGK
jgi:hypothetical protein